MTRLANPSPLCRRALEAGAVLGAFCPIDLVARLGLTQAVAPERAALWRELSAHVTEVIRPAGIPDAGAAQWLGWELTPDTRRAVLADLGSAAQARAWIEAAPPPLGDGDIGPILQALLLERPVAVDSGAYRRGDSDDLLAEMRRAGLVLDALQFAQAAPFLDHQQLEAQIASAKRHIFDLRQRRDLLVALPHKHVGYETQREVLSRFLRGQTDDTRPMFLSGIGGMGKSALHARLFQYWQRRKDAPVTITLDFDRRQLAEGAPVEIYKEMFRQMSVAIRDKGLDAETAAALSDGLRRLRVDFAFFDTSASFDRQLAELAVMPVMALRQDWAAPLRDLPIAMTFDSFEALERRGGANVEIVLRFERLFRGPLPGLRTLFAGREDPLAPAAMAAAFGPPERRIRLDGLSAEAGAQLLAQEDARMGQGGAGALLPPVSLSALSDKLHGHPLALLMLVRFAHRHPAQLGAVLGDLRASEGALQAEFAQVFLYQRIVERIDDPDLRALAHPGLVLRSVGSDLIRYVLSGPCFGRDTPLSEAEAGRLRAAFAREYWLVEEDPLTRRLRHRPGLRRLVLPGMFAGPAQGDTPAQAAEKMARLGAARAVCAQAVRYYTDGPPQADHAARDRWFALGAPHREAHVLYYIALLEPEPRKPLTAAQARNAAQVLGGDLETMPAAWRAQIKAHLERALEQTETVTLDGALFEKAQSAQFRHEQKLGHGGLAPAARPLPRPRSSGAVRATRAAVPARSAAELERDIAIKFAAGDFAGVRDCTAPYLTALLRDAGEARARFMAQAEISVLGTPLWQLLLAAITAKPGRPPSVPDELLRAPDDPRHGLFAALARWPAAQDAPEILDALGRDMPMHLGTASQPDALRYASAQLLGAFSGHQRVGYGAFALAAAPPDRAFLPDFLHQPSRRFADTLQAYWEEDRPRHRDLRTLYDQAVRARVVLTPQSLRTAKTPGQAAFLRGLSPELMAPMTTALRSLPEVALRVIDVKMRDHLPRWPADMRFDSATLPDIAPLLVETADRHGALIELTDAICGADETATDNAARIARDVRQMHDVIGRLFFE